ncbi:MAG: hypothetical protein MK008_00625 [Bdellovibrionales bacterium]|nr:hypothetical protein [Bdellovibrionales bacterium]
MKLKIAILLLALLAFATGCEDEAKSKIYDAQACLDNLDETVPYTDLRTAADACQNKLGTVTTQEANTIRCSARLLMGGMTANRFAKAADQMDGASNEAALISVLSLKGIGSSTADKQTDAKDLAKSMFNACTNSGVPGLVYIAGLSLTGTVMTNTVTLNCNGNPNASLDECSEDELITQADQIVSDCQSGSCEPESIGQAAVAISDAYCTGDKAEEDICVDIEAAITAGGGNSSTIGEQLLNLLANP